MNRNPPVLGTAQLGFAYGVANKTGKPDQLTATAIVREAWQQGIREFDTAQAYGSSEQTLATALAELGISDSAKVITKPNPDLDHGNAGAMTNAVRRSLETLGIPSLYGIMFHREKNLSLWDRGLSKIAQSLVSSGLARHIGLSVYSPEIALAALNTEGIDMVQVPSNILDRRFENAGVFNLAREKNKTVYIRSAFLQGLILMQPHELPETQSIAKPTIEAIHQLADELGLSPQEIALGYLKDEMPEAKIIFGAETPQQVAESYFAWLKAVPGSLKDRVKTTFPQVDERILNPTMWR